MEVSDADSIIWIYFESLWWRRVHSVKGGIESSTLRDCHFKHTI